MEIQTSDQEALRSFSSLAEEETEPLRGIYEKTADGCREALVFAFAEKALVIEANPEDDTVQIACKDNITEQVAGLTPISRHSPLGKWIGKRFGWGWITINQQGYRDGVLLSFGDRVFPPALLLEVSASSIGIHEISELRPPTTPSMVNPLESGMCAPPAFSEQKPGK